MKLEAEREELLICAAFLKKRQDIELEEARLKACKEQLELEAKISASDAKIKVYADYEGGQDGMTEYYESKVKPTASLKDTYHVKKEDDESQRVRFLAPVGTQPPAQTSTVHHRALPQRAAGLAAPPDPSHHVVTSDGISDVMQRQNEITEMLIKQRNRTQLLHRDVPTFSGDPLSYRSFIRTFEQAIEDKTASQQDRLFYLQQFTRGEPQNLVRSCEHMRPDEGYKEARRLLQQHYRDELQIATAFMNKALQWPQIKTEDRKALNAYALFLIGC